MWLYFYLTRLDYLQFSRNLENNWGNIFFQISKYFEINQYILSMTLLNNICIIFDEYLLLENKVFRCRIVCFINVLYLDRNKDTTLFSLKQKVYYILIILLKINFWPVFAIAIPHKSRMNHTLVIISQSISQGRNKGLVEE